MSDKVEKRGSKFYVDKTHRQGRKTTLNGSGDKVTVYEQENPVTYDFDYADILTDPKKWIDSALKALTSQAVNNGEVIKQTNAACVDKGGQAVKVSVDGKALVLHINRPRVTGKVDYVGKAQAFVLANGKLLKSNRKQWDAALSDMPEQVVLLVNDIVAVFA